VLKVLLYHTQETNERLHSISSKPVSFYLTSRLRILWYSSHANDTYTSVKFSKCLDICSNFCGQQHPFYRCFTFELTSVVQHRRITVVKTIRSTEIYRIKSYSQLSLAGRCWVWGNSISCSKLIGCAANLDQRRSSQNLNYGCSCPNNNSGVLKDREFEQNFCDITCGQKTWITRVSAHWFSTVVSASCKILFVQRAVSECFTDLCQGDCFFCVGVSLNGGFGFGSRFQSFAITRRIDHSAVLWLRHYVILNRSLPYQLGRLLFYASPLKSRNTQHYVAFCNIFRRRQCNYNYENCTLVGKTHRLFWVRFHY